MPRYTIYRNAAGTFNIMGTYPGANESEALDALARDEQDTDFAVSCRRLGLRRDDYRVREVIEELQKP